MFVPNSFVDGSAGNTPITAATLNNLELGLVDADITNPASAAAVALAANYARPSIQLRPLMSALTAGQSAAFGWHGDSTGASDGTNPAIRCTPENFARQLAAKFPSYHVLMRSWNASQERFDAPVVLQSATAGQAYAQFNGRSSRYPSKLFTSSTVDVRAKVDLTGTAGGIIACQIEGSGATYNTQRVFAFQLDTNRFLQIFGSYDGTQQSPASSSVALPLNYIGWVRGSVETVIGTSTAGSVAFRFWTSADGITWTQLGATQGPYAGTRPALWQSTQADFEIGGSGWQPNGSPIIAKIYEVEIRDGLDGPLIAPALPQLWERYPDASTTFGGAPTLYVINASASGTVIAYHVDTVRGPKMTPNYGQSVEFFNDSHNEGGVSGPKNWLPQYLAWVNLVLGRVSLASVVAVLQNPHTAAWTNETAYGLSHPLRLAELSAYAPKQGWGTLDLYSAFLADPRGLGVLIGSDGLHPTQTGYLLAGLTAGKLAGLP